MQNNIIFAWLHKVAFCLDFVWCNIRLMTTSCFFYFLRNCLYAIRGVRMCSNDKWMVPTIWKTLPNTFENGKYLLTLRPQIEGYTHLLFSILPTVKVQLFWPQKVGVIFHLFWHLLSKSADLSKQLEDNWNFVFFSETLNFIWAYPFINFQGNFKVPCFFTYD